MAPARIVEAVDVFEDGDFGITTRSPGPVAPRANAHNLAKAINWKLMTVFFYEGKPHLLLCAKNTVAFFNTSLSSRSMRFSFRSSAISRSRSDWAVGFSPVAPVFL